MPTNCEKCQGSRVSVDTSKNPPVARCSACWEALSAGKTAGLFLKLFGLVVWGVVTGKKTLGP